MALADRAELAVRLTLDDRQFSGPLRRVQGQLGGFAKNAGRVGKGVGQIGTGLARAGLIVGGAAITGITAAAKAAIDFEDAFAGVRKTVSQQELTAAGLTFEDLALSFRQMATEMPIAATEFARIGETAGALGIKAQDIDDFTKTVALLGVTTNLTTDEAAESLGKLGTILGFTGKDFEHAADVLVNLGNQGASTESEIIEITKRFAAQGKQAGLATEQIFALASATASLGIEPEAGGSALSRIFSNMATEIANGTAKGKEFAEITGSSMKELREQINKGDSLGILLDTLKGISGLSRTKAASVLKALGITNVRDRNAILLMSQNLDEVQRQLQVAGQSTGALSQEAQKRFDTVASKLGTFKNQLIEIGIEIGEGMLPAIGKATDKLGVLLKDPEFRAQAMALGKNIGDAINSIDWAGVIRGAREFSSVLKTAFDFTMLILRALNTLPTEVKALGIGFLTLNKLSGGLIGSGFANVIGGLAGGFGQALTKAGIGKFFVQPVFVTNPGFGLGGGLGGAAAAAGGIGLAGLVASAAALVVPLVAVQKGVIEPRLNREAGQNINDVQAVIARGSFAEITSALAGLRNLPNTLDPLQRVLYDLDANGVRTHTESLIAALEAARAKGLNRSGSPDDRSQALVELGRKSDRLAARTEKFGNQEQRNLTRISNQNQRQQAKLDGVRQAQQATKLAVIQKLENSKASAVANTARLQATIRAAVPIVTTLVNVYNSAGSSTVKTGTTVNRTGTGGSGHRRA